MLSLPLPQVFKCTDAHADLCLSCRDCTLERAAPLYGLARGVNRLSLYVRAAPLTYALPGTKTFRFVAYWPQTLLFWCLGLAQSGRQPPSVNVGAWPWSSLPLK